ncbi:MAG: hypothetical protein JO017_05950, partial [Actinobacteria bacterium]|nr:hypothetical protein [Actinomycetota bacterium]
MSEHDEWPGAAPVTETAEEDTGEEQALVVPDEERAEEVIEAIAVEDGFPGHAPGALHIPDGVDLLEGSPQGTRKRI